MVDEATIKPVFNIPSFIKKEPKTDEEVLTDEEKVLAAGANTAFWTTLKKHIDNEVMVLDQIAEQAIEAGSPLEEIGRNTIVISQVKGVINRIFNVVQDSREAQENAK